jgi:hypothetical protein
MRALDAENRKLVELAKPVLDLNDIKNHRDARQIEKTKVKIDKALARFAESLEDQDEEMAVDDDRDVEEDGESMQLAGNGSEDSKDSDDDDEDEENDQGGEPSVFNDLQDQEFQTDLSEVLRHMAASKTKPPPSSIKPKSSARTPAGKKKASRKSI